MAKHAADYANVEAGAAAAFADRARAMALKAIETGSGHATTAVFAAKDGRLTVTIGAESATQALS
jgi:glucose/arabinose dehydrogenase